MFSRTGFSCEILKITNEEFRTDRLKDYKMKFSYLIPRRLLANIRQSFPRVFGGSNTLHNFWRITGDILKTKNERDMI
jgi:hypothetical protein